MDLDDTLAAWATTVRLPDTDAAGIYHQIVTTPTPVPVPVPVPAIVQGLDPAWWREFTTDFTALMVASTRPATWVS